MYVEILNVCTFPNILLVVLPVCLVKLVRVLREHDIWKY